MYLQRLTNVTAVGIAFALASAAVPLLAADSSAIISKFVGTWRGNETKRKIGSGFNLRFRSAASGGMEELRGPEARPLVQPVKFGTKPYGIDNSKNMIAWKQIDANHFERKILKIRSCW